jgi:hypothetical protein
MLRSGDVVELGDVRLKFVPAGVEDVITQAAPLSIRAAEIDPMPRSRSGKGAMALYMGGALLAVAVIALAVRPAEDTPTATSVRLEPAEPAAEPTPEPVPARVDGAAKLLEEASGLVTEGAIVAAHRKLSEIPQDSGLRQGEVFKSIERRWADEIFKAAEESPDPEERRNLLDKVAKTPEVDAERRQRAASELAKLDEGVQVMDVADLPSADGKNHPKPPGAKPPTSSVALAAKPKPAVIPSAPRRQPPTAKRSDEGEGGEAAAPPPTPAPKPAAKPQPPSETGLPASELTREPPF